MANFKYRTVQSAVLVFLGWLPAQSSVVFPPPSRTDLIDTLDLIFEQGGGSSRIFHLQNVFRTDPTMSGNVLALAFRREESPPFNGNFPLVLAEIHLGMSHCPRPPERVAFWMPGNRGADVRLVVQRKIVSFPAVLTRPPPYAFTYRIPFDQPFPIRADDVAMWEITNYNSTVRGSFGPIVPLDARAHLRDVSTAPVRYFGAPCNALGKANGDNRLTIVGWLGVGLATLAYMNPQTYGGGAKAVFGGLSNSNHGNLRLPHDLTPYGAPGCHLYVSPDWVWPTINQFGPGGFLDVDMTIPPIAALEGLEIYAQGVTYQGGNALGLTFSQGVHARIGPPFATLASTIYGPLDWRYPEYGQARIGQSFVFELTLH